jgi:hypothetical protein
MKCRYHLPFKSVGAEEHFGGSPDFQDDIEDAVEIIRVMKEQEKSYVATHNYLKSAGDGITDSFRRWMCGWCFQIVDSRKFSRYTAYVTMSCVDRFLCTSGGGAYLTNTKSYQLVVIAALHIAIKVHEPTTLDGEVLTKLCRGVFSPKEINEVEQVILLAINWCVNPPSPQSFVKQFVAMLPSRGVTPMTRQKLLDVAAYQNDQALSEMSLVQQNPSAVSMAILLNALSFVPEIPSSTSSLFLRNLGKSTGCTRFLAGVNDAKKMLREHANFAHHYASLKDPQQESNRDDECTIERICSCVFTRTCDKPSAKINLSPLAVSDI